MLANPDMTIKEVAETFGVNRSTIYRSLGLALTPRQRRSSRRL
jgi:DNA-binding transcriptional MerR regulator